MQDFINNVHGRDSQQDSIARGINLRNLISLIVGGLVLVGLILPYFLFGQHNLAVVYMAYFRLYIPLQIIGTIICIVLFIVNLICVIRYHFKPLKPILIGLLSIALSLSPYIYSGATHLIALLNPHTATAGTSSSNGCPSSQTRSENPYLLGLEGPNGSMAHLNAWDGVCAYLEAYYRTGQLPDSQDNLMPYIQSYEVKNGTVQITINGKQPHNTSTVNIITERSCNYSAGKNTSVISVWYRDPRENNELACETIETNKKTNLYDLQASRAWYSKQFDQTKK